MFWVCERDNLCVERERDSESEIEREWERDGENVFERDRESLRVRLLSSLFRGVDPSVSRSSDLQQEKFCQN